MIRGNILRRRLQTTYDKYIPGQQVELLWCSGEEWRWVLAGHGGRGMHPMDLYVVVDMTKDELEMEAMLHPVVQQLLTKGRLLSSED